LFLKKYWPFILIFFLSLLASWPLLKQGFFTIQDTLQILRLVQMDKCFQDGQIPCRWVPDLGAGFGFPLFNYYPPLVYYLGLIPHFFGMSFIGSIKILFILGIFISGISMFLLAKEFWGNLGGLVSAVFYIFAPFHAFEVYVRGDLAEFWALALLPLVFWSFYRLFKDKKIQFFIVTVFSLSLLLISHNITVLISIPFLFLWIIYFLIYFRSKDNLLVAFWVLLFGFGLASFFLIPAWFEKSLVQVESLTSGYFDFRNHFINLRQLLFNFPSFAQFTAGNASSVVVGLIYWVTTFLAVVLGIWEVRKTKSYSVLILFFALMLVIFSFMTNSHSHLIWERFSVLAFVQFPWRFVGLIIFCCSFMAGFITKPFLRIKKAYKILLFSFFMTIFIVLNLGYFKPKEFLNISDKDFLNGDFYKKEQRGSLYDFLPKTVKVFPDFSADDPKILIGKAKVSDFSKKSDYFKANVEVFDNNPSVIFLSVFNFPNWKVLMDGNQISLKNNPSGLIAVEVPPRKHEITGWFENTKIRLFANSITLISLFLFLFYLAKYEKISKKIKE